MLDRRSKMLRLVPLAGLLLAPAVMARAGSEKPETAAWTPTHTFTEHTAAVADVAFSPDGKTLASGGGYRDGTVRLWDVKAGKLKHTIEAEPGVSIGGVAFSPDGKLLAVGRNDLVVTLLDAKTLKPVRTLRGLKGGINAVAFSADGKYLAAACNADDGIGLWTVAKGELVEAIRVRWGAHSVAFSPDGKYVAGGARFGSLGVWKVPSGSTAETLRSTRRGGKRTVALSPDGTLLAAGGRKNRVTIWDWRKDDRLRRLEACCALSPVAFSPDGKRLATGGEENEVKIWDPQTGKLLAALEGHRSAVASLAFSPDGTLLASGGTDYAVRLWRLAEAGEK